MNAVVIRRATLADVPAIARVHVASWQTTYCGLLPDSYIAAHTIEGRIRQQRLAMEDNSHNIFVAEDNRQQIVGFASGGPGRSYQNRFAAELYALYLLQEHQRQGIGRSLMQTIAEAFFQQALYSMFTWVLAANPARFFYQSLGGRIIEEKVESLGGQQVLEIAYAWDDIRLLTMQ